MISKILTHPGGAHRDDFFAVCLFISKHRVPVVRREPTSADLDDVTTIVIDVGGEHSPARMNFDHHHFPRDHRPPCAFSLVLQYLGLYEDAQTFWRWLAAMEWFDSKGPSQTARWLGVEGDIIGQLSSPLDGLLLQRFAASSELAPSEPLYEMMALIGGDLIEQLEGARRSLDLIRQHVQTWPLPLGAKTCALFLPRDPALPENLSNHMERFVYKTKIDGSIVALIYPDRRGSGYGIKRFNDHPRVDFGRIRSEPDVRFVHANGFVCKTTTDDPERLKAMIVKSWL